MNLIKKKGVRDQTGLNVGQEVYEELEKELKELIQDAENRADGNGRRTIKARDV